MTPTAMALVRKGLILIYKAIWDGGEFMSLDEDEAWSVYAEAVSKGDNVRLVTLYDTGAILEMGETIASKGDYPLE